MDNIYLWESNLSKNYKYISTIEELERYVEAESKIDFEVKNFFVPGDKISSMDQYIMSKNNKKIIYTDIEHPICINKSGFGLSCINEEFYQNNKQKINKIIRKKILQNNIVDLYDYNFDDQLLNAVLENKSSINFHNIKLTDKQISKIKNSYINAYIIDNGEKKQISSKYLIGYNTKDDLENKKELSIPLDITDEQITYLKFLKENSIILINNGLENKYETKTLNIDYYKKIDDILQKIDRLDKKVIFKIKVDKRSNFNKSGIMNQKYKNIDIVINNDFFDYPIDQYKEEENNLNKMVKDIVNSDMSQLERYICVYNIVKKYKPYKENNDDKKQARNIRFLLNNEYIVCAGYTNLLKTLLDKVGIQSCNYSTSIYKNNTQNIDKENKKNEYLGGHARLMINIKDEKYGINGFYITDPTWDNHKLKYDTYNYLLNTQDSMQESAEIFSLNKMDYIFDNHNFDEYVTKINTYLKHTINNDKTNSKYELKVKSAYNSLVMDIFNNIMQLDIEEFDKLNNYFNVEQGNRDYKFYQDFLTDVGNYIILKANKKISDDILATAISNVKNRNLNITKEFLEAHKQAILEEKKQLDEKCFPYETFRDNKIENMEISKIL